MQYSVKVTLSNGQEISFLTRGASKIEVRNSVTNTSIDEWQYFDNASGTGFFKRKEVVSILIKEVD